MQENNSKVVNGKKKLFDRNLTAMRKKEQNLLQFYCNKKFSVVEQVDCKEGVEMQRINLEEVRQGFQGKPFSKLIEYHLQRQKQNARIRDLQGTIQLLPEEARPLVESFIDRWNERLCERDFLQTEASHVFDQIVDDARNVLVESGIQFNDETLFDMFNIIVLNCAYSAYDQPKTREFMGIHSVRFPWWAYVGLVAAPILFATIYYIMEPAATLVGAMFVFVGTMLCYIGYDMLSVGMSAKKFKEYPKPVYGFKKRWQVFVAGLGFVLIGGAVLSVVFWFL